MTDADLYGSHYACMDDEVYRAIRAETFGEDLGQESWITAAECDRFGGWLRLAAGQRLLEVACGAGGVTARLVAATGAAVVGIDVHEAAIVAARRRGGGAEFQVADADRPLPFPDASFDALFCNDAINHLKSRLAVFREWRRVLRRGGRCLFTDPVVVTGTVSAEELAARSSIGFFLFSAPGVNEALLEQAGFRVTRTVDVTDGVARTSGRWAEAREKRRAAVVEREGEAGFEKLQRFLRSVHRLAMERRLSRFAFVAEAAEGGARCV